MGKYEIKIRNHGKKIWRRLENKRLGTGTNTNYETHRRYMHAQMTRERNEKSNTARTTDVTKSAMPNEPLPNDKNTNKNTYPKYTIKQEIEEAPP
jgi:hypothetical protein